MSKKSIFLCSTLLVAGAASAQKLAEGYVVFPQSTELSTYVSAWNGGAGTITMNGSTWEDEEFFTSRVKPKERFYNTTTQIYPEMTQYSSSNQNATDKRYINWVPIGNADFNALPNAVFDSEAFSMWSYVDHYGNWTMPYGWVIGAAADAAHKNGVAMSGVASIPFGSIPTDWANQLNSIGNLTSDEVGKFLYYHGVDGLGYNSEFSGGGSIVPKIRTLHDGLYSYMSTRNPIFENVWYGGTNDNGSIAFDTGLSSNQGIFKGSSIFLNYNWNNSTYYSTAPGIAKGMGRNPFHLYAGMNQEGSSTDCGGHFAILKNIQYSIGIWGSHQVNQFWKEHGVGGTTSQAVQKYYLSATEDWYTNVSHNPAIRGTLANIGQPVVRPNWAGISASLSARSTLAWNLLNEPFYTFFNLGNGAFFNWKGERVSDNEWYNLGIQDFLPTWRFWFADTWMNKNVSADNVHMTANFTWDDAYVGGSCLRIAGTSATEYLHLFKSNFAANASTTIRVTFKVLAGSADIDVALNQASAPGNNPGKTLSLVKKSECEELEDTSFKEGADGWITREVKVGSRFSTIGVIAFKFSNAENLELLLGGLEVVRNESFAAPAAPEITLSKVLAYNNAGVDAKLIWNMANDKASNEPCYNSDVNTSMFRMWAQQNGGEPVNMGITTSWAGIIFAAPVDNSGAKSMRFGVSALSLDTKQESEITWTDYITLPDYQTIDEITINKGIIKPGESFELSFVDPVHTSATWTITDDAGTPVWSGEGVSVECPGLDGIGAYNLTISFDGKTQEYTRYIAISSEAVGALPEIYSIAVDGADATPDDAAIQIKVNDTKTLSYTGRPADGSSSRGIDLNENWFGVQCGEIGLGSYKSFSVAAWIKYNELPTGRSNFITVEDRINGGWPYNNWGFFWSRINDEGRFIYDGIDTGYGWRVGPGTEGRRMFYRYNDAKVDVGAWTHVAIIFEYNNSQQIRSHFYINGKKQMVSEWCSCMKSDFENNCGGVWSHLVDVAKKLSSADYGTDTYEPTFTSTTYPITDGMWISFGGSSQDISAVKGCVDDFQVWGKAMTDEDVMKSMQGLDKNNLPEDVLGYWDLENEPASDYGFVGATGANATNKTPKAYWCEIPSQGENSNTRVVGQPTYLVGCPFIAGTAYPVVTTPTWETRRAEINGSGTGESGSATLSWTKAGDYSVKLRLANGHGEATMDYPVVKVSDSTQGIGEIGQDGEGFTTYTVEDALFVEFDADGAYTVEVYNMAGMLAAQKAVNVVAGQNVSIALGQPGVYLVKVTRDGQLLRTVKVIRK